MIIYSEKAEQNTILRVAEAMCAAARTAPKAKGEDYISTAVLTGDDLKKLADKMNELCKKTGMAFLGRDAGNVLASEAVVLIGTSYNQRGLSEFCSLCNFTGCDKSREAGAVCVFDPMDLGIAIGSAVAVAADNRIDNRIMFSAGKAALELNIFDSNVKCIMGIPLAATGKNVFFDRKPKK